MKKANMQLQIREFIKYKFLNSLFFGISVGSIFILYTPLEPSIYSAGGIILALGTLVIAKIYSKILNIEYFFKISVLVELIVLCIVTYFLIFNYNYMTALLVYIGYQLTFMFGSYLLRAETVFLKKTKNFSFIDVAKQKGYLIGLLLSFCFYKILEIVFNITDKQIQVYDIHFLLILNQFLVLFFLFRSFKNRLEN